MPAHVFLIHAAADEPARRDLEYALAYLVEPRRPDAVIDRDHHYVETPLAVREASPERATVFLLLLGPAWDTSPEAREQARRALDLRRAGLAQVVGICVRHPLPRGVLLDEIRVVPADEDGQLRPVADDPAGPAAWLAVARELEPLLREHAHSPFFQERAAGRASPAAQAAPTGIHSGGAPTSASPDTGARADSPAAPAAPTGIHAGGAPTSASPDTGARAGSPAPLAAQTGMHAASPAPMVLGRFRRGELVHRELGAEVFAVADPRWPRVRLKVRSAEAAADDAASRARFAREVDVLSRLTSPHFPRVYDFGDDPAVGPVIAMEALEGETLLERVKRGGPLPFAAAHPIFEQVFQALGDLHAAGALHLHLDLSRIWLTPGRGGGEIVVKVSDLGGCFRPGRDERAAVMSADPGFFWFAAPETVGRLSAVGPPADVYSAATCLFTALAGQTPFKAGNALRVVEAKSTAEAPRLADVTGAAVSPALDVFLARALARRAEQRFSTAESALSAWRILG